jgi:UDP-N-acetylmuramoyl-tripeptide--D-alanyl-D-alanine ligase
MYAKSAKRAGLKAARILEFDTPEPVVDWLDSNLSKGDVVLIKGSHGLRMDRIIAALEMSS